MAVNHNFKEGIDWLGDPTGETPLANHTFVSISGNDSTGNGSPQSPYRSIQVAGSNSANGSTIVVGAGKYNESNVNGVNSTMIMIGDGVVLFEGDNTNTLFVERPIVINVIFQNIQFIFSVRGHTLENCTAINCGVTGGSSGGNTYINSILVNCNFTIQSTSKTIVNGCILINSIINMNRLAVGQILEVKNTFIDESSQIITNEFLDSLIYNFNAINGSLVENGVVTKANNIFNVNPAFNNKTGFDLAVNGTSELISAGQGGVNIGNVVLGKGLFQGVSELDLGIDANPNLSYNSLGEIEIQAGGGDVQTFETEEEESLELSVLGATRISGFIDFAFDTPDNDNALVNPNQLILEINVALLDGIYTGWKKYRWNEKPTQNNDGTPNGDSSYNWAENNNVPWKKRKYRITLRNDYNQA